MTQDKQAIKFTLPKPSDELYFFERLKEVSNKYWQTSGINYGIYGFQIQPGTKWRNGLTESQIADFEKEIGLKFPFSLYNFYKTMNGVDKPGINVYGSSGEPFTYRPVFYSFPDDIIMIKEYIEWIHSDNQTNAEKLKKIGASRIFPIYHHRCMLLDTPTNPILSMYGNDIIYWCDSLSKLLATEIFEQAIDNAEDFISVDNSDKVVFWLNSLDNQP
jgi:hypothetical protein